MLVGDSIARYMMCFISKVVASEYAHMQGLGCEPELTRGVHYQFWPTTTRGREKSPVILHFVSDFYFPETHMVRQLDIVERENAEWLPPLDAVLISRGTWDNWIRLPRPVVGRHMFYGYSEGLFFIRKKHPTALVTAYGLSQQYPARYHRHSERCATKTSYNQIRGVAYCAVRRANALISEYNRNGQRSPLPLEPIHFLDFYHMTTTDLNWYEHTMNHDGMHFIKAHAYWFPRYYLRLLLHQANGHDVSVPPPLDMGVCSEDHLPLNTMPHQKKMKNHPKVFKIPTLKHKIKRDCGIWLREKVETLDFHKSFNVSSKTVAAKFADCIVYHKASTQRLGGIDPTWTSQYSEILAAMNDDARELQLKLSNWTSQRLWAQWSGYSESCRDLENQLVPQDIVQLQKYIEEGDVACSALVVLFLRCNETRRRQLRVPTLREQRCDMLRKGKI
jgi:hypothetical protein